MKFHEKIVGLYLCSILFSAAAFAQGVAGLGAVSGTVRDASGAVVPDATVVLSNESKGIKRTMQSTDAGVFNAPALVPATGLQPDRHQAGLRQLGGQGFSGPGRPDRGFQVVIQVSAASTKVEVTAEAPLVEDTKSGVTQVVSQTQIDGLPINGRRADTFVLLTPAVTPDGTFGLVSFRGISSGNSFLTDGNDTTNSFYNENAGRTRISTQISQDAVQEFQVLSDGFSAEFGRAIGGVINTVTRSGTNEYHGTGYEFFRNRTLNAPDRYAAGFNAPEWRHQAGGTLGGPIKKDKLFFFSNFELVKRNFPGLNRIINTSFTTTGGQIIPTLLHRHGGAVRRGHRLHPEADGSAGPAHRELRDGVRQARLAPHGPELFQLRCQRDALAVALRYSDPGRAHQRQHARRQRQLHGRNTLRKGVLDQHRQLECGQRTALRMVQGSALRPRRPPTYGPPPARWSSASTAARSAPPRPIPAPSPASSASRFVDNYSWTHGAHSVKFGVDWQTTEDYMNQLFNGNGTYNYSNLTNFAKDFTRQHHRHQELLHIHPGVRQPDSGPPHLGHQLLCAGHLESVAGGSL